MCDLVCSLPLQQRIYAECPKFISNIAPSRARHVKCDDRHPFCLRCIKSGRECAGYVVKDKPTSKLKTPPAKLLPKSQFQGVPIPPSMTAAIMFQDETEQQYFRLFREEIASDLSGGFDATVWNRVLLSACDNRAIRQLAIATAALKQATNYHVSSTDAHRDYALRQYGRALQGLRGMLDEPGKHRLRIALLAALLIFCFEMMLGDPKGAVTHLQSAMQIIRGQLRENPKSIRWSQPRVTKGVFLGSRASLPYIMEDELLEQYASLDRAAVGLISTYFPPFHHSIRNEMIPEPPRAFTTVTEAREFAEYIKVQIPVARYAFRFSGPSWPPMGQPSAPMAIEGARHLRTVVAAASVHYSAPVNLSHIHKWIAAFSPSLEEARASAEHHDHIGATTVWMQVQCYHLGLCNANTNSKCSEQCTDYKTLIDQCRSLVQHPRFLKSFVFEPGIIPLLWFIMVMCTEVSLKEEAVQILRDMKPRKECIWCSQVMADLGDALLTNMRESRELSTSLEEVGHVDEKIS
jgi:hypothetical protein